MSRMFKPERARGQSPEGRGQGPEGSGHVREVEQSLPSGDYAVETYKRARAEYDERIGDAAVREKRARIVTCMLIPVLGLSVLGNVYQGAQSKTQVVHVLHDSVGRVVNVEVADGRSAEPSQPQVAAALRDWIANVRSVYADKGILTRDILAVYKIVSDGSSAAVQLNKFYQDRDPFKRAAEELVYVVNAVALAPSGRVAPSGEHTWSLQWIEETRQRDGTLVGRLPWEANVTLFWRAPRSVQEAIDNPDGLHITAFTWTSR